MQIAGFQVDAHAALGEIRTVLGEMTPPRSVVVPEVVIWIASGEAQGRLAAHGDGSFHG